MAWVGSPRVDGGGLGLPLSHFTFCERLFDALFLLHQGGASWVSFPLRLGVGLSSLSPPPPHSCWMACRLGSHQQPPPPPTHSPPTHCLRTRPRRAHRMMSGDYSLTLVCAVRLCMLCTRPAPADIPASVALAFCARYPCQMHSHAVHVCVVVGVCVLST